MWKLFVITFFMAGSLSAKGLLWNQVKILSETSVVESINFQQKSKKLYANVNSNFMYQSKQIKIGNFDISKNKTKIYSLVQRVIKRNKTVAKGQSLMLRYKKKSYAISSKEVQKIVSLIQKTKLLQGNVFFKDSGAWYVKQFRAGKLQLDQRVGTAGECSRFPANVDTLYCSYQYGYIQLKR